MTKTGKCLCGQVSYALVAEPAITAVCHCKNCQRQSGSALSIVVVAPTSGVELSGTLKVYEDTADSGAKLARKFCPECGSAMFSVRRDAPSTTIIKAGTLDDTSWLKPVAHVWCNSAQPWVEIGDGVAKFPENAPKA